MSINWLKKDIQAFEKQCKYWFCDADTVVFLANPLL